MGKLRPLHFRSRLAKQLMGGFSYTSSTVQSSKCRKLEAFSLELANAGKSFQDKIKGRKRKCVQ